MNNHNEQAGFTLIELMIVIAIIGILMAYAIPAYKDYTTRTLLNEGTRLAGIYKSLVSVAHAETGSLTGLDNNTNGIKESTMIGHCVNGVAVDEGVITITYDCATGSKGNAHTTVDAARMVWTPNINTNGSALQWTCSMQNSVSAGENPCPK